MYLSRLKFDPRHPDALRKISSPYAMHQYVYHAFPDGQPLNDSGRGILWRIETANRKAPTVVVLSRQAPDWSRPDNRLLLEVPEQKTWNPVFTEGQRLCFRLRANPTRRIHEDKKRPGLPLEKGMRVALLKEHEQLDWMIRRARSGGFQVSDNGAVCTREDEHSNTTYDPSICWFHVENRETITGRKPGSEITMTWQAVTFEGQLQVTDPEAFRKAVESGIGSAKAFGFGLLSLARPR